LLAESTHGALHLHGLRDNVQSAARLDRADGDDVRAERRAFTADERLQRGDDGGCDDDGINCLLRHGRVTTFAFDAQHKSVNTGKDWARTYPDAAHLGAAHEMQAEHAIDALQDSFFQHEFGPTPAFFSGLE